MNQETGPLRILFFQEEGGWVGQCLEYDIAAQAGTLDDAMYEILLMVTGMVVIRH